MPMLWLIMAGLRQSLESWRRMRRAGAWQNDLKRDLGTNILDDDGTLVLRRPMFDPNRKKGVTTR